MPRRSPSKAIKEPFKVVKMSKKGVAGVFLFVNILLNKKNVLPLHLAKIMLRHYLREYVKQTQKRYRYGNEKNLPAFSS